MEISAPGPATVDEAIEDLQARFLNIPVGESPTVPRVFFLLQQAHWYYEDEMLDNDETGSLHHLSFGNFSRLMLAASPMLREYSSLHDDFRAEFNAYSAQIPKYGVVLLNSDATYVLLVAGYGSKAAFSFPKGKVNQGEAGIDCAARETYEETGYNPRPLLSEAFAVSRGDLESGDFIKLYIAWGVPDDGSVTFSPVAKKEIGSISWVEVASCDGYNANAVDADGSSRRVKTYRVGDLMPEVLKRISGREKSGAKKRGKQHAPAGHAGSGGLGGQEQGHGQGKRPRGGLAIQAHSLDDAGGSAPATSSARAGAGPGVGGGTGWSVSDMFAANEKLTGREFTYTGKIHEFGVEGGNGAYSSAESSRPASRLEMEREREGQLQHLHQTPVAPNSKITVKATAGGAVTAGKPKGMSKEKDADKLPASSVAPKQVTKKKKDSHGASDPGGGAAVAPAAHVPFDTHAANCARVVDGVLLPGGPFTFDRSLLTRALGMS